MAAVGTTPAPWAVRHLCGFSHIEINGPDDAGDDTRAIVGSALDRGDAELIVRAVNAYEALLINAQGALGYLEALPEESRPDEAWFKPLRAAINAATCPAPVA